MEPLIVLGLCYFAPTLIGLLRGHHNALAIFALNALLGWTVLGWIAAFIWSLTATLRPSPAPAIIGPVADTWNQLAPAQRATVAGVCLPLMVIAFLILLLLI